MNEKQFLIVYILIVSILGIIILINPIDHPIYLMMIIGIIWVIFDGIESYMRIDLENR